jgi:hypothetical protein
MQTSSTPDAEQSSMGDRQRSAQAQAQAAACAAMVARGQGSMVAAYENARSLGQPEQVRESAAEAALADALPGGTASGQYATVLNYWMAHRQDLLTGGLTTINGVCAGP